MLKIGTKIDEVRIDGNLQRLRQDLEYFSQAGLAAAELPVHGLDAIKNGRLDKAQLKRIKETVRNFSGAFSVHAPNPLNLMDCACRELHLKVFRASLEFTAEVGAEILVYHPGRYIPEVTFPICGKNDLSNWDKQNLLAVEAEMIQDLADEYPEVTICLENARPYLFHSPYCYAERLEPLQEQVAIIDRDNVKINLDLGHLFLSARFYGFDPVGAAAQVKDFIAHSHVHDNFGNAVYHHEKQQTHQIPFGKGDAHMPVGWGEIPILEILSTFLDSYTGMLMMELRDRYFAHTRESKENLEEILIKISST
ncbi:MAG: sugar phosphate isomerase/epimerase family protein [Desulfobaccales bacterium]